ncbi:MAG: FadR family transcriptional regulator [Syntrophaceae bacterium]|nr:FadR family transcriptional regulator [Syntrophaceae bacterium]
MVNKQSHQKVSTVIMRDIFFHKLKPGEKLPPERELSETMNVDRTTLRIALKQLEAMQLLEIRRGDGIYVKDFVRHAGIDFLRVLFSDNNPSEDELAADMFMLDEVWEWWIIQFPEMIRLAAKRASARDLKELSDVMDKELECKNDREKLIELWIYEQDRIAEVVNNMVMILIFNSTKPLRINILRIFMNSIPLEQIEQFINAKKSLLMEFLTNTGENLDDYAQQYRLILMEQRQITRNKFIQSMSSGKAQPISLMPEKTIF